MSRSSEAKKLEKSIDAINDLIMDSMSDIKAKNIVKLDLRHLHDGPTDYFIICEGDSNTQVRAIAENIKKRLKQEVAIAPSHYEGQKNARWVCLDYFNTVVHVFYPETREFYALEELWSDAEATVYDQI